MSTPRQELIEVISDHCIEHSKLTDDKIAEIVQKSLPIGGYDLPATQQGRSRLYNDIRNRAFEKGRERVYHKYGYTSKFAMVAATYNPSTGISHAGGFFWLIGARRNEMLGGIVTLEVVLQATGERLVVSEDMIIGALPSSIIK